MKKPRNRMASDREQREHPPKKIWPGDCVDYNPAFCPNCGSTLNVIVKTFPLIPTEDGGVVKRHHDCSSCGTRFSTAQRVPRCDSTHYRSEK